VGSASAWKSASARSVSSVLTTIRLYVSTASAVGWRQAHLGAEASCAYSAGSGPCSPILGEMGSLAKTLTLRTAQGLGVIALTAALALAIPRWAHPEMYPNEQGWGGLAHAMGRAFFHFDFGVACGWVGCPRVRDLWVRGYAADVWMLFGTVAIGVGAGFALGLWCAGRADSRRARLVEKGAVILYCTPVYVLGLGVLLLFHPTFGTLPLPYFFDAAPIRASPLSSPWDWFRSLLVPWLVAAAPLAGMCLRLVLAQVREQLDSDPCGLQSPRACRTGASCAAMPARSRVRRPRRWSA
jgi:hypothetical protein